ncbi:hypothetical protein [Natronoflexus pectinivorans]|uniref:Uncharacterized protein n=1 Tax=Natronoflexus pectinivorans TaxID=682526 RepID=A0A4R2GJ67_9BACT|nr:hypothetical protein [Natronoflexus pectinivorans]TCO08465.1 hypothetical protein EV194_105274 [Natronoflexus pectinivorans]
MKTKFYSVIKNNKTIVLVYMLILLGIVNHFAELFPYNLVIFGAALFLNCIDIIFSIFFSKEPNATMKSRFLSVQNKTLVLVQVLFILGIVNHFAELLPYNSVIFGAAIILGSLHFLAIAFF